MTSTTTSPDLHPALIDLRAALGDAPLGLDTSQAAAHRQDRHEMVDQLDDYVLPRVVQADAPLLAVVGGSTGAGKSTLVNSLIGRPVSQAGVLRPTTRSPVLVHNAADAHWFGPDRILPELARTSTPSADVGALHLVASAVMPPGLALLDAPDVDSVERANRTLATQLLAAADLWLFITSAARYADQVPWGFLRTAAERSTAVAIVLDRTPVGAEDEIRPHLQHMLVDQGLRDTRLFAVPECTVDVEGLLPKAAVAEVRGWLDSIASDATARSGIIQQTLSGAVRQLVRRGDALANAVDEQHRTAEQLRADVVAEYQRAVAEVGRSTGDGTLLRGEVLARWQEFIGAGELTRKLELRVGRLRDWALAAVRGRQPPVAPVERAVQHGLHTMLVERAESAAERAEGRWAAGPAGQALLGQAPQLGRATRGLGEQAEQAVRDWQGAIVDLVRAEGADKRSMARALAFGINGLGVALMVVVFVHTAGLTGAEAGVAGGTAVIAQKVLEAVFGDQAVRSLADRAHADLMARAERLLAGERDRFLLLLDEHAGAAAASVAAQALRAAVRRLDAVRPQVAA
ncbi:MAG: dynamin family protein [Actinomycetota bacterium]|nr:dynamin family protein [Actinomycetota bacterium]